MTRATAHQGRRGFTLFEMVLTVAGAGVVLSTAAGLLFALMRLDRGGRAHLNDTTAVSRLARQFRQDIREAGSAERGVAGTAKNPALTLATPDGPSVVYEAEGERLTRTESADGKVVRREWYPTSRLGPVAFETDGPYVRLALLRKPEGPGAVLRPAVRIDARLNKRRDLSRLSGAKP